MSVRWNLVVLPLVVGWLGCGGAAFSSPDEDGGAGSGGATGQGGGAGQGDGVTVGAGPITGPGSTGTGTTTQTGIGGSGGVSTGSTGGAGPGGSGGSGTGGRMVDAQVDAPIACDAVAIPVRFRMTQAPGSSFCINYCSTFWLTILPASGGPALTVSRGCNTTCTQCQPMACGVGAADIAPPGGGAACIAPQPFPMQGLDYTWDGTLWERSTCGAQGYACVNEICSTPPGKYIARMCANRSTSDSGTFCMYDSMQTCVDVPFEYPPTAVVEGVLH